jgi:hypothetical protein
VRYVLFACASGRAEEPGPEDTADDLRSTAYARQVRHVRRGGARLCPPSDATTVRVRGDEVLLTDGPFVESREYVADIDIVEVADLDEAIALAARHPAALGGGSVEVRPVWT